MRIDFGAKVRTKDGHDAGSVRRVIVDPSSQRVTGFVVSTSRLLGRDVIVAEDEFLSSSGDTITLDLTKAELDRQPSFEEASYTLPPVGWVAPLGYGLPADAYLLPVAVAPPPAGEGVAPTIKKGDAVKDRDGDTVGVVREVGFDEKTGDITGFVVIAGGGLERLVGGGQAADIQREAIARVAEGTVYLNVDRDEIVGSEHEADAH
ncbi:MAG: hypothetical protein AUG02_06790 [Chloroflexi bacterium 13_1_20CM_2_70_9]|nr:MAG: hypothetical protein AUG02_06790 [Chloroflexi bacterium 13_1_20CM_2_70_9]